MQSFHKAEAQASPPSTIFDTVRPLRNRLKLPAKNILQGYRVDGVTTKKDVAKKCTFSPVGENRGRDGKMAAFFTGNRNGFLLILFSERAPKKAWQKSTLFCHVMFRSLQI